MKLKQYIESYSALVSEFLRKHPTLIPNYSRGNFIRAEKVKDLQMRFRWDVFHALNSQSGYTLATSFTSNGETSDHVDTLLRKCTPEIPQMFEIVVDGGERSVILKDEFK